MTSDQNAVALLFLCSNLKPKQESEHPGLLLLLGTLHSTECWPFQGPLIIRCRHSVNPHGFAAPSWRAPDSEGGSGSTGCGGAPAPSSPVCHLVPESDDSFSSKLKRSGSLRSGAVPRQDAGNSGDREPEPKRLRSRCGSRPWPSKGCLKRLLHFKCHYWKLLCPEIKEMSKNSQKIMFKNRSM